MCKPQTAAEAERQEYIGLTQAWQRQTKQPVQDAREIAAEWDKGGMCRNAWLEDLRVIMSLPHDHITYGE